MRPAGSAPDEELVARALDGEEAALGALVDRHHAAAYRAALAICGEDDLAQDVVQDAFLKAFRGLAGFRHEASFRTWLLTIVANETRGALRRRKRRRESTLEEGNEPESGQPSPAEVVDLAVEAERARDLLRRLPEKQRLSVTLRIEEDLSFREIGAIIDSSEGAARVNYFHGIRRLRELMNEHDPV